MYRNLIQRGISPYQTPSTHIRGGRSTERDTSLSFQLFFSIPFHPQKKNLWFPLESITRWVEVTILGRQTRDRLHRHRRHRHHLRRHRRQGEAGGATRRSRSSHRGDLELPSWRRLGCRKKWGVASIFLLLTSFMYVPNPSLIPSPKHASIKTLIRSAAWNFRCWSHWLRYMYVHRYPRCITQHVHLHKMFHIFIPGIHNTPVIYPSRCSKVEMQMNILVP